MTVSEDDLHLSWSERWFALKAFILLQLIRLNLRLHGFTPVYYSMARRLASVAVHDLPAETQLSKAIAIGRLVAIANRRFPWLIASCLPESLAVWWQVRRLGIPADLRLGVRKLDGSLDGHAWVEVGNRVVSGDPNQSQDYLPLQLPA